MIPMQTKINLDYRNKVDTYWANFLGCRLYDLQNPGDTIVYNIDTPGLFCLETGKSRVISLLPGADATPLRDKITTEKICEALAPVGDVAENYGPGDVMYCTPDMFAVANEYDCRKILTVDRNDLRQFAHEVQWSCFLQECADLWEFAYGIRRRGKIVSAATAVIWGGIIGAVKVATLPEYRNRGFAHAVVSAVTRHLLTQTHLIPQYDAAAENVSSLKIAQSLGFQCYGQIYYGKI